MANEETPEVPPLEPGQEEEAAETPPVVLPETVPSTPTPTATRQVEVTRIPPPVVVGNLVIFPRAHGVDYTIDGNVQIKAISTTKALKVKAAPKEGYKFAKGLKQTFNVEV